MRPVANVESRVPGESHRCTIVALLYHLCNSTDLSGVIVPETGQFKPRSLEPLGTAHFFDARPVDIACETEVMPT